MISSIYRFILAIVFVLVLFTNSFSQVEKGDNIIGLATSISTRPANSYEITWIVQVSYDRYLSERWAVGVAPVVTTVTRKSSLSTSYGINVYGNYGFITYDGKLYPYVGIIGSVSQGIASDDYIFPNPTDAGTPDKKVAPSGNASSILYGGGAKAGVKYFLSERINLDLNINYSTNLYSTVNGDKVDIGTGGIIQAFAGIGVMLGKKSSAE